VQRSIIPVFLIISRWKLVVKEGVFLFEGHQSEAQRAMSEESAFASRFELRSLRCR
jgi:hypothetical protein